MDFSKLQGLNLTFDSSLSNTNVTSLPSIFLDSLIPGYGLISQIIYRLFGFDIGLVVSGVLVVYGLCLGAQIFYRKAYGYFYRYFMSNINIDDSDKLFDQIMEWIAQQRMTKRSRALRAVTVRVSKYHESNEETKASDDDVLDESGIFNYEKWASTIPPQYEPNFGSDRFWFQGRMFFFRRSLREREVRSYWSSGEDQFLDISCIGRSTEPIKNLLSHIKNWCLAKDRKMTAINRPAPKEERKNYAWDRQSLRPSRPISTVSLDQEQKVKIVTDINEYLHPASARWYAARGIPYRRGYLFHGPPGTGKTSLSFALAGIFGLDIYCISLMEVGLTESELNRLFSDLPRRCIVLLEDIDSAGLRRPDEPSDAEVQQTKDDSSDDDLTKIRKSDALPTTSGKTKAIPGAAVHGLANKSLITLSGLLNAIDGVASHEGRVLIMTTNCPSKLDSALIRPGRVDLQVGFTLATRDQIRDIFQRMYSTDCDTITPPPSKEKTHKPVTDTEKSSSTPIPLAEKSSTSSDTATPTTTTTNTANSPSDNSNRAFLSRLRNSKPVLNFLEPEELQEMSERFANLLPEDRFSPAEIQGFLLMRKKEPRRALEEVERWRDSMLEGRKRDAKVLDVQ